MTEFMDNLFEELAMLEVNFELQEVADQLKEQLAEIEADLLFFDNHLTFVE